MMSDHLYIGVMIDYLERILQMISDFFGRIRDRFFSSSSSQQESTETSETETTTGTAG